MKSLRAENRAPSVIVLENVCGALTSHGGEDFAAIGAAIVEAGYRFETRSLSTRFISFRNHGPGCSSSPLQRSALSRRA